MLSHLKQSLVEFFEIISDHLEIVEAKVLEINDRLHEDFVR